MTTAKYIVHTADIHIGHPGRDDEYLEVFRRFAEGLPNSRETLVIIAGDIFHHKTRYSGADVDLFNKLMAMLAEYPVVIIPGNHDTNMNNLETMDLITPVLHAGKFPNVHYWKYTGEYMLSGVKFYHVSVFGNLRGDGARGPPLTTAGLLEKASKDTILLYHGMVNGVVYGTQVAGDRLITREVMAGFGAVMLGDIHEHQYLMPSAAYPGSLIQQNVAESQDKGYLLWDMGGWPAEITSRRVIVPNSAGFVKLDFRGMSADEIAALIESRPLHDKMHKISVVADDASAGDAIAAVEAKFGRVDVIKKSSAGAISAAVVGDCLRGLLKDGGMDESAVETCVEDYVGQIVTVARGRWYLRRLEWDNLFKYGPGNAIDFQQLNAHAGISGVIAGNHRGKSSIFDIIAFGLFNEHLRGKSVQDIIRKEATGSRVSIEFVSGGDVWRVTRVDTRARHTDLKLHQMVGDTWVNKTSETATGTYARVVSLIGTFTQLMATGMYYDIGYELTHKKPADCLTMMTGLIGLDCNEKISAALDETISRLNKQIAGLVKPRVSDDSGLRALGGSIAEMTSAQSADEATLGALLERIGSLQGRLVGVQCIGVDPRMLDAARARLTAAKACVGTRPDEVDWREEWRTPPTITPEARALAESIQGTAGEFRGKLNCLSIDHAVKTAAVESLKERIKSRGNPDIVNKIPALKEEITRLTVHNHIVGDAPAGCRTELSAELSDAMDIIAANQPLVDTGMVQMLETTVMKLTEDISRLKQSSAGAARAHQEKIAGLTAGVDGRDVGVLSAEHTALEETISTAEREIAAKSSGMKLVEAEALGIHIESLRTRSGMHFMDGCTACIANKSMYCDGLAAAEETYMAITADNEALAVQIAVLREELQDASRRRAILDDMIIRVERLAAAKEIARADATAAIARIQSLTEELKGWTTQLEAAREQSRKIASENIVRSDIVREATAERDRARRQLAAIDTWEDRSKAAREAIHACTAVSAELVDAEAMLEVVKQYGQASAQLKDISAELTMMKAGIDAVVQLDAVRKYEGWVAYDRYKQAVKAATEASAEYDGLCARHEQFEAHKDDVNALREARESADNVRVRMTDRAVCLGVARRDLVAATAEVDILREYEREYPKLRNQLEVYKKYRAVVKSGGLKAGVVNKYLEVVVGRANDMLKTVSAGFTLTCSVDASGVAFGFIDGDRQLPLGLASGFQRFISALTFRMAMISVLAASPSFIMIDEGFGCMDDENLLHAIEFLESCVLRDYEFVFVISHKEELRNTIRAPLCILGDSVSLLNNTMGVITDVPVEGPSADSTGVMPAADAPVVDGGRVQCECGALVMKKSLRAHLQSGRHRAAMEKLGMDAA